MRTKIRLTLDFIIQLILISFLLVQIKETPMQTIQHLGVFAFFMSIWQIGHAVYVVQKHQDWYRGLYLKSIKKVIWVAIFILGVATFFAVGTLGILLPYVLQGLQVLGLGLGVVVALLAFQFFGRSLINLYSYYNQPKSFWDL